MDQGRAHRGLLNHLRASAQDALAQDSGRKEGREEEAMTTRFEDASGKVIYTDAAFYLEEGVCKPTLPYFCLWLVNVRSPDNSQIQRWRGDRLKEKTHVLRLGSQYSASAHGRVW